MKKIVFVCTGNICRSAMAHGYMQKILIDKNLDIFKKIQNSFGFKVQTSYNVWEREQYENSRKVRNENGKKRASGNEIFE